MNKKSNLILLPVFIILGIVALQIPFTKIIGSTQKFSLFDFIAPVAGGFLGSGLGFISIVAVKIFELIFSHKVLDLTTILRLLPLPLAALYFGSKSKLRAIIPVVCMILFISHPQGRQAWYYSLYWLFPIADSFINKFKSLGATFTAHAVGSVVFLYAFNLQAAVWKSLIPVVAIERLQFALGIWLSYKAGMWLVKKLKNINFGRFNVLSR